MPLPVVMLMALLGLLVSSPRAIAQVSGTTTPPAGTARAWGANESGQLGDGTTTDRATPVQVANLSGVVATAGGFGHSLALTSDGTMWAWGANGSGQLGDGTTNRRTTPTPVPNLLNIVAIATGHEHSVALKSDGTVWAWGANYYGQLGDGAYTNRATPMQVPDLSGVVALASNGDHTLALKSDGTVWAWGYNVYGQLGDGTYTNRATPVQVANLTGVVVALAGGALHSVALKSDGTVMAWGANSRGQLGNGTTYFGYSTPMPVLNLSGVVALAARNHSLALKSDGTVMAWGENAGGQLGDGTTTNRSTPVPVSNLSGAFAIAAGRDHSAALKSDGTVVAWGYNTRGQLGDGTTTSRFTPAPVPNLSGVGAITGGFNHTLVVFGPRLLGPTPYLRKEDSPFWDLGLTRFYLEDFEDGLLNVPGVTAINNNPRGGRLIVNSNIDFNPVIDSVDADDGVIDGYGQRGHCLADAYEAQARDDLGYTFRFDAKVLGQLPTHVGIVWTDGSQTAATQLEVYDANGKLLGIVGPVKISDYSFLGETEEDRFFGAIYEGGIGSIIIRSPGGQNNLTVDHLQYGFNATVTPPNNAPTANSDAYSINEDTTLTIAAPGVMGNDTDADGDTLTAQVIDGPANGTLTLNNDGSFTYTPKADFNGTDTFTYQANDGKVNSNTATVTITVNRVNDAPVASDQALSTDEDTSLNITLTASDADGDTLTYGVVAGPANGTLSGTGANLTYTPNPNFNGTDTFTYKANDGATDSNVATVTITITPVNDAPTADAVAVTTNEDNAASVTLSGSDPDGDALTFTVVSQPTNGTLSGTGANLTYTPSANFNGTDTFTYKVNDGTADSNVATVTITVNPVNDAPVALGQAVTTDEDTAKDITLTGSDMDGDTLTYQIVAGPTRGTLSGTGASRTYTPNANYNGPDSFTYKANDGTADSNVATVTITVNPVNDAPVADGQSVQTNEDTAKNITLTGSDVDGDTLAYTVTVQPQHGTLSGAGANRTYTPNLNYNGPDSFTFQVSDGKGGSSTATVNMTVTPVNDAPDAVDDPSVSTPLNTTVSIPVLANDTDVDSDVLNVTAVTQPAKGTVAISADGKSVTYNARSVSPGTYTFTYTISDRPLGDPARLTDTATVTVKVTAANRAPVAADDNSTASPSIEVNIAVLANDSDPDNDPLTVTAVTTPIIQGTKDQAGTVRIAGDGKSVYFTPYNFEGYATFKYTISDGRGGEATAMVKVYVSNGG